MREVQQPDWTSIDTSNEFGVNPIRVLRGSNIAK